MTITAIAEAVLAVGFQELTFAAVAQRLGIGQATLFRYVPNRDELVRVGLDLAIRRFEWPSFDGRWDEVLQRWAVASWRAWEAHPGAVIEATRGLVPTSMVALADELGAVLIRAGFSAAHAVLAVDLVFDLAADNRRGVETLSGRTDRGGPDLRQQMDQLWCDTAADSKEGPSTAAERQAVRGAMVAAIRADPIDWFLGKLAVVLAGIERELAPMDTGDRA